MKRMVRKQFYLSHEQDILLQKLAKQHGVSESEIIQKALEHEAARKTHFANISERPLNNAFAFVAERNAKYAGQGEPVIWNRDELHERGKTQQ